MLKKLVKYDLLWINKSMIVFFIVSLIISILTRIVSCFDSSFVGNILYIVFKSAFISCIVSIIINCCIRIWVRFRNNIYKDESYLTHTLPVTKNILYNSKILSSILSILISLLVVAICFIIVYLDNEMINKIKDIFSNNNVAFIFISILILMIFEAIYMTLCGIVGLIIGHKSNNNKIVMSVIAGLASYFIIQSVIFCVTFGIGLINSDINSLFSNTISQDVNFEKAVKSLVIITNVVYAIFITGIYLVGKVLFKKGVNVD